MQGNAIPSRTRPHQGQQNHHRAPFQSVTIPTNIRNAMSPHQSIRIVTPQTRINAPDAQAQHNPKPRASHPPHPHQTKK
ncbi:hypothetical protein BS50DRAFT_342263 [Corynespora cassiicola Philippines]|uniref:Uncharacterized protein n=1 Tax=Corynespora cassiicola Philippines TaxID=1448308 RepID=A0A2T2NVN4_CORCC|nr:hypothetical protein BS50DRAFT_342263 [Corynespora cassiicola Philippines]